MTDAVLDDDFMAAFGAEHGETPAADPQPEQEPEATEQADDAAPEPTEQPEAQQPDPLALQLAKVQSERDALQQRIKSDEGRVSAYQRKYDELRTQLAGAVPTDLSDALASLELVDERAAAAIKAALANQPEAIAKAVAPLYAEHDAQVEYRALDEQERAIRQRQQAVEALTATHADWREVAGSPEFGQFMQSLPSDLRQIALTSNDPATVGNFISQFKQGRAAVQAAQSQAKQTKLAGAVGIPASGQSVATAESHNDSLESSFNYWIKQS